MNSKLKLLIACGLLTGSLADFAQDAPKTEAAPQDLVTVSYKNAPLSDVIDGLARQASINYIPDPKIFSTTPGPDGKMPTTNMVSIRWENITPMQALQALLDNYNLQMTTDPKTKVARVTAKDPAALEPLISRVVHLRYANTTNTLPIVQSIFTSTRSKVIGDVRTSHLILLATEKELMQIEDVVKRLDTSPTQILIEAKFIETSKNPKTAKGVDWSKTLEAQNIKYGNAVVPGTTVLSPVSPIQYSTITGFGGIGYINADGLDIVLSFINQDADSKIINTPRAVALEGVDTELAVVRNIPIFEQEQAPSTGGTVPPATVKPNYNLLVNNTILNEVGTKLIVNPRVFGETNVFLILKPEISAQDGEASVLIGGIKTTSPIFKRAKVTTQSMVPSGSTLVLGGLNSDTSTHGGTKVPLLGDIPALGRAFRSETKERDQRTLVIFVTPTILTTSDYQDGTQSREFMKSAHDDLPQEEWSAWDSATPHDWSKPVY